MQGVIGFAKASLRSICFVWPIDVVRSNGTYKKALHRNLLSENAYTLLGKTALLFLYRYGVVPIPLTTFWLNFILYENYHNYCLKKMKHKCLAHLCITAAFTYAQFRWDTTDKREKFDKTSICFLFWKLYRKIVLRSVCGCHVNCRHAKIHYVTYITSGTLNIETPGGCH